MLYIFYDIFFLIHAHSFHSIVCQLLTYCLLIPNPPFFALFCDSGAVFLNIYPLTPGSVLDFVNRGCWRGTTRPAGGGASLPASRVVFLAWQPVDGPGRGLVVLALSALLIDTLRSFSATLQVSPVDQL